MKSAFDDELEYIQELTFLIGGYFGGYETRTYTVIGDMVFLDEDKSSIHSFDLPIRFHFSKEEFIAGLKEIQIGNWKEEYIDPTVLDGTHWELEICFCGERKPIIISGSNDYPDNFKALTDFLGVHYQDEDEEKEDDEYEYENDNITERGTGFAAPIIGTLHPKGSTIQHNADGTITIIPPEEQPSACTS